MGWDHDDGQGPVHPEDLDHPHNIGTPNHPPGIPNPAINYAELIQTAERYKQLLAQAQMQNLQNVQTIQALTAKPKYHGGTNADNAAKHPTANKHCKCKRS